MLGDQAVNESYLVLRTIANHNIVIQRSVEMERIEIRM